VGPPGWTCCDGRCVDLKGDEDQCGATCRDRNVCAINAVCIDGTCTKICLDGLCPEGQLCRDSEGVECRFRPLGTPCTCGCGPNSAYCHIPGVGWRCLGGPGPCP
jgi:hypothetical protein